MSRPGYPRPTAPEPDPEQLIAMEMEETDYEATDGCGGIEPDGTCQHGYPSWLIEKGLIR